MKRIFGLVAQFNISLGGDTWRLTVGRSFMDGTTDMTSERKPLEPILTEDGAIEEAFAALDARIAAFASAIAHAVAELGAADQAVEQPEAPAAVEEPQPRLADVEADPVAETDSPEPVEPEPTADQAPQEPVPPEPEVDLKRDVLGRAISSKPEPVEAEEPPADTHSSEEQDDDALLASLDVETAKAIRVMRRLSPVKKRVSDLLEEYRASQAAHQSDPKQKKKSWWTRG